MPQTPKRSKTIKRLSKRQQNIIKTSSKTISAHRPSDGMVWHRLAELRFAISHRHRKVSKTIKRSSKGHQLVISWLSSFHENTLTIKNRSKPSQNIIKTSSKHDQFNGVDDQIWFQHRRMRTGPNHIGISPHLEIPQEGGRFFCRRQAAVLHLRCSMLGTSPQCGRCAASRCRWSQASGESPRRQSTRSQSTRSQSTRSQSTRSQSTRSQSTRSQSPEVGLRNVSYENLPHTCHMWHLPACKKQALQGPAFAEAGHARCDLLVESQPSVDVPGGTHRKHTAQDLRCRTSCCTATSTHISTATEPHAQRSHLRSSCPTVATFWIHRHMCE